MVHLEKSKNVEKAVLSKTHLKYKKGDKNYVQNLKDFNFVKKISHLHDYISKMDHDK